VAPDEGLSTPFNNLFVFFGQFFDHRLDITTKNGSPVFMPLQPDDPLMNRLDGIPDISDEPSAPFIIIIPSRAINDSPGGPNINQTTTFVDQQQTYASHPSVQVFFREYYYTAVGLRQPRTIQ